MGSYDVNPCQSNNDNASAPWRSILHTKYLTHHISLLTICTISDHPVPRRRRTQPDPQHPLAARPVNLYSSMRRTSTIVRFPPNILSTPRDTSPQIVRLKIGLLILVVRVCPLLCHPLTSARCSQWRCSVLPTATMLHCGNGIRGS
jgi:hypothetical protein